MKSHTSGRISSQGADHETALSVYRAGVADGWEFVAGRLQPLRTHHHHGDQPEHDADGKQNASNRVLHRGATSPGTDKEGTRECAQDRQDRRAPEVLVINLVLPKHKNGDVDNGEDTEKEEGGRAAKRWHRTDEGNKAEGQQRGEGNCG